MKRKLIIDTDPGHDDAMALMLACKSPELNVLAVTTVCGNSTIENTTRNARFILDALSRPDIPVYAGADKPLARDLIQAVVHGESGLDGAELPNAEPVKGDAVDHILDLVRTNPKQITIVTLGPMTNIAAAISRDPETMKLVKRIVSMACAIAVPGNKNRVAEFNVFVDPEAADIVMRSPIPKTIVPLDASNHVVMREAHIGRIKNRKLRALLSAILKPYIANILEDAGIRGALMYDPLTIFYILQPESCSMTRLSIQIETKGHITRGMSVADRRTVKDDEKPNATVVMHIKANAFLDRFIRSLSL